MLLHKVNKGGEVFIIDIGLGAASAKSQPKQTSLYLSPSFPLFRLSIFVLISLRLGSTSDHFGSIGGDLGRTRMTQFTARYGIREFSCEVRFR